MLNEWWVKDDWMRMVLIEGKSWFLYDGFWFSVRVGMLLLSIAPKFHKVRHRATNVSACSTLTKQGFNLSKLVHAYFWIGDSRDRRWWSSLLGSLQWACVLFFLSVRIFGPGALLPLLDISSLVFAGMASTILRELYIYNILWEDQTDSLSRRQPQGECHDWWCGNCNHHY